MPTITVRYKCNACTDGIVKKVLKETVRTMDLFVKDCDKCGKSFGIKSISTLEKIEEKPI